MLYTSRTFTDVFIFLSREFEICFYNRFHVICFKDPLFSFFFVVVSVNNLFHQPVANDVTIVEFDECNPLLYDAVI